MRNFVWVFLIASVTGFVTGCSSPSTTISPEEAAAQQQRANQAQHELGAAVAK